MILTEIPRAIARHLKTVDFFRTPIEIPVIALCEKDIISVVEADMARLGISVTVPVTGVRREGSNFSPGCQRLSPINIAVMCREHIEVNRSPNIGSGVACESLIEAVIANLVGIVLTDEDGARLILSTLQFDEASQEDDPDGLYSWTALFSTSGLLKAEDMTQLTEQEPLQPLPH